MLPSEYKLLKVSESLADNEINILMITTSEIKVTCVIARDQVETAVRALHDSFELAGNEVEAESA